MIVAIIYWNTEADGTPVDNINMEKKDMPQCWYGAFASFEDAVEWLNDWPDGDTDIFDTAVGHRTKSQGVINDATAFRGGGS